MNDIKIKKEIVLLLKPMTKINQLNGKSEEDVFRRGCPVLKNIDSLIFAIILTKIT